MVAMMMTGCIDKRYDIWNMDLTTRFYVDDLTLPINMDPVSLDLLLSIPEGSDVQVDETGNYYYQKEGIFYSDPIRIQPVVFKRPDVDFGGRVDVDITLNQDIKNKMAQFAGNMKMSQLLNNPTLMAQIGITPDMEILRIDFDSTTTSKKIKLNANNIDASVRSIDTLGISPMSLGVHVEMHGLTGIVKPFGVNDLDFVLPCGLIATTNEGLTYDAAAGRLTAEDGAVRFNPQYVADLDLTVTGLCYDQLEEEGMHLFDPTKHTFNYEKLCSVSGNAVLKVSDIEGSATYNQLVALEQPEAVYYECEVGLKSDVTVTSFLGKITYTMDDIAMDPILLTDLPSMLSDSGTNIVLHNPQIYLDIENYLSEYGIAADTKLEIQANSKITAPIAVTSEAETHLMLSPLNEPTSNSLGYLWVEVPELTNLLSCAPGQPFPKLVDIRVVKPTVPETQLKKPLPLGEDIAGVAGSWIFYTQLNLDEKSYLCYSETWDDIESDILDNLTVTKATIEATITKNIALDAEKIEFILTGWEGEMRGETALLGGEQQDIKIVMQDSVYQIYQVQVNVYMRGMGEDLNENQQITISNFRATLDGYYGLF